MKFPVELLAQGAARLANALLIRLAAALTEPAKPVNPLTYKDVAHIQRQIDSATRSRPRP